MAFKKNKLDCEILLHSTLKNFNSYSKKSSIGAVIPLIEREFGIFLFNDLKLAKTFDSLEMNLLVCGRKKIKNLNKSYRSKDKVTDVLSFPAQENLRAKKIDNFPHLSLGDVVICLEVLKKQARQLKVEENCEFIHLLVHGFLHLCGFDHEISINEERKMEKFEDLLVGRILKAQRSFRGR